MDYIITKDGELYHHGVKGMKWGVIRSRRKAAQNERLRAKALTYDKKSAKLTKKSEKIHAQEDLEGRNKAAKKAANLDIKAAKLAKKANRADNAVKKSVLEYRSENAKYKAVKAKLKANRLSKTAGYGAKAMKYSIKSDKVAIKAAKARKKIAKNERYIQTMNRKMSSISDKDLAKGRSFTSN
jgi:hypothetical protein